MKHTPFQDLEDQRWLEEQGFRFAEYEGQADVLIAERMRHLRPWVRKFGASKRYLLWTAEPRRDTHFEKWFTLNGASIRVMNAYTGDVYLDNLFYLHRWMCKGHISVPCAKLEQPPDLANRMIVVVAGGQSKNTDLVHNGVNIDLCRTRYELAIAGYRDGSIDIYGRGWPAGMSKGHSRGTDWVEAKRDIIEGKYRFNLCFENTRIANYCTEKIWDAIRFGCLPIYVGSTTIYDDFPKGSFLDLDCFESRAALLKAVEIMDPKEFQVRYNLCVDTLNRRISSAADSHRRTLETLAEFLR